MDTRLTVQPVELFTIHIFPWNMISHPLMLKTSSQTSKISIRNSRKPFLPYKNNINTPGQEWELLKAFLESQSSDIPPV
jgi:hypothetical protein